MQKPRLYALLGRTPRLNSSRGDLINEMRSLRILSTHFDVYYNNERFVEGLTEIGNPSGLGPDTEYDYYYLRNSPDVFSGIDGRRIAFAYPYDSQTFENAYGLIVPTANWKRHLLAQTDDSRRKVSDAYGCDIPTVTAPVLVVGQSQDPGILKEVTNERDIFPLRAKTTMAAKIFGYYGNLSNDLYPRMAFRALERLADEQGTGSDILVVLAGHFRKNSKISLRKGVHIGNVPYDKMSALHTITLANLTNESPLNHCLGNQKVIDSISRGIPMMCQKLDTFVEQLGDDYPCFYETENEVYEVARRLVYDPDFVSEVRAFCLGRATAFEVANVQKQFLSQPELELFA